MPYTVHIYHSRSLVLLNLLLCKSPRKSAKLLFARLVDCFKGFQLRKHVHVWIHVFFYCALSAKACKLEIRESVR